MKYEFNDAGRSQSKRPKQKNDCVVRAIALASPLPYDTVYDLMWLMGRKSSHGTKKAAWQQYLNSNGYFQKISFPAVAGHARMNLDRFCREYSGKYIVQMAGHLTTVFNGVVLDTFEPRANGCVYAVWKRI